MSNKRNACKCGHIRPHPHPRPPKHCRCNHVRGCSPPRPPRPCKCSNKYRFRCPCPPELSGMGAQLRVANNIYVDDGEEIVFDIILSRNSSDITYNGTTGRFCLRKKGTYLINWDVAVEGSYYRPFIRLALIANNTVIGSSTLPVTVGQLSGTSLLNVGDMPVELSLINNTEDRIQLSGFAPVANITITKVTNSCN